MKGNTQIFPNSEENNHNSEIQQESSKDKQKDATFQSQNFHELFSETSTHLHQEPHHFDFQQHSKIETVTPSESLADFPNFYTSDNYAQNGLIFQELQQEGEQQLCEEIAFLREENMNLREEMMEIRETYEQALKQQEVSRPIYSTGDVNRLVQENRSLEEMVKKLAAEKSALKRDLHVLQENLLEISNSNQIYYNKLVAITNELERQRRDSKMQLKECEERLVRSIEKEQRNYAVLAEELTSEKEENENLRMIINESNQEITRINQEKEALQEQCEALASQKQELNTLLQQRDEEEAQMLKEAIQARVSQISQLRQDLFSFEQQNQLLHEECQRYKHLYQSQLHLFQQSSQTLKSLQRQYDQHKKINNNNITFHPMQTPNCASLRRVKLLCNESNRKILLNDLKRAIKDIGKIQLENRVTSLVMELCMDAEYRERTNLQMQEIIVQLEKKLAVMEMGKEIKRGDLGGKDRNYVGQLEASLDRYEQLLLAADSEKLRLVEQLSILKKENYQIRLELANSSLDNQTEELIEQLTLQLEQEKHNSKTLQQENQSYREEIRSIQRELNEKNKRIKLLTLSLNKKGEGDPKA